MAIVDARVSGRRKKYIAVEIFILRNRGKESKNMKCLVLVVCRLGSAILVCRKDRCEKEMRGLYTWESSEVKVEVEVVVFPLTEYTAHLTIRAYPYGVSGGVIYTIEFFID